MAHAPAHDSHGAHDAHDSHGHDAHGHGEHTAAPPESPVAIVFAVCVGVALTAAMLWTLLVPHA